MAWNDTAPTQKTQTPKASWDSEPPKIAELEKIGKTEALARGIAQGITLGWGDEASASLEKAAGTILKNPSYEGRTFSDLARLDREKNRAAQHSSPGAYGSGELIGGLALTPLMPSISALPSVAGRIFTKEGAKLIGKAALRGGAESGILSTIAGAGAAEGAPSEVAKQAATRGLWGTLFGALTAGTAKPVTDKGVAIASKAVQSSQGLPNKVLEYLRKDPKRLPLIQKLAKDKNGAIADLSDRGAAELSEAFKNYVSKENQVIDSIIDIAGDKPIRAKSVVNAFDKEIKNLSRGGITAPVKTAINQLKTMKNDFIDKYGLQITREKVDDGFKVIGVGKGDNLPTTSLADTMTEPISGVQSSGILKQNILPVDRVKKVQEVVDPYLTAKEINILRKEVNNLASPAYRKAIGDNPVVAEAASSVGDSLRNLLDEVDDHVKKLGLAPTDETGKILTIRQANQNLKKLIEKRNEIASKFGAKSFKNYDNEIDPSDVQKILTRYDSEIKASDRRHVDDLSDLTGVDLKGSADLVRAVKSVNDDGAAWLSKFMTGRSVLLPILGGALGAGGAYGTGGGSNEMLSLGALGALLAGGAQSPAGLNFLLNNESVRKGFAQSIEQLRRANSIKQGLGE